ncbi:MAG: hypothetical protein AUG51_05660 [Acidobacteria bacterium 13_1_20CM_3_53_8]|nr:MAG: hypothetical protein AUG51_05660 [Acidobacteria bacterium 13_1_20CM_3_53_8]
MLGLLEKINLKETLTRPIVFRAGRNNAIAIAHNNKAMKLAAEGQYEEALAKFQLALLGQPHYARAYYNMALTYFSLERYEEAIDCFEKAIEFDPRFVEALNDLGVTYANLQQGREAIKYYHRALRIKPNYYDALLNLGAMYYQLGDFRNSIKAMKKALAINDKEKLAYYYLALIHAEWRDRETALKHTATLEQLDAGMADELRHEVLRRVY